MIFQTHAKFFRATQRMTRKKGDEVQWSICKAKVEQYPSVRTELLGTGDALLLHQDNRAKVRCARRLLSHDCCTSV